MRLTSLTPSLMVGAFTSVCPQLRRLCAPAAGAGRLAWPADLRGCRLLRRQLRLMTAVASSAAERKRQRQRRRCAEIFLFIASLFYQSRLPRSHPPQSFAASVRWQRRWLRLPAGPENSPAPPAAAPPVPAACPSWGAETQAAPRAENSVPAAASPAPLCAARPWRCAACEATWSVSCPEPP